MKIAGIIAEYNPFHKGHQFHIEQTRRQTGADYVIAIISGSFVQRGGCAIADKYTRARAALLCGADLVLELPVLYASSSAELFAAGAVRTLDKLGIVSHLSFGCETDDILHLKSIARILAQEPDGYQNILRQQLRQGLSFPKAREQALKQLFPALSSQIDLNQPNTILGIEYCKSLFQCGSSLIPVPVKRLGGGYHQQEPDAHYSSADCIRTQLAQGSTIEDIASQLPPASWQALKQAEQLSFPLFDEDLSSIMRFTLMNVPGSDYTPYLDVSEELSNRIRKYLFAYTSFHSFAALLKTKDLTYSRICRCLIHILLGITNSNLADAAALEYVPYIRVLGIKSESTRLLGAISRNCLVPIVASPAEALRQLSAPARKMLELDCLSAHIWNGIAGEKFRHATECEYTRKFMKL